MADYNPGANAVTMNELLSAVERSNGPFVAKMRGELDEIARLQKQVKELQDLLAKEKDRSGMFRKQRDELQGRLDLLRDVLDGFDPRQDCRDV